MKKTIISTLICLFMMSSLQASQLDDYIIAGNTLWSQGKLVEAEVEFKKAIEINPDSSVAHARLANLYLTQNKTTEAVVEFQNAINNDPENAKLFIGLAITYLHKQYYEMAEAMVNQAIELNPEFANAQKLKAYMDAKKERMGQMAQVETTAPSANSSNATHHDSVSPHGKPSSVLPATVQKSLNQKTH